MSVKRYYQHGLPVVERETERGLFVLESEFGDQIWVTFYPKRGSWFRTVIFREDLRYLQPYFKPWDLGNLDWYENRNGDGI